MSCDDLTAPADAAWLADTRFVCISVVPGEVELALAQGFELIDDLPSPYGDERVLLRYPSEGQNRC